MDILQSAQDLANDPAMFGTLVWAWALEFLPRLVTTVLILVLGYVAAGWAARAFRNMLARHRALDGTLLPVAGAILRYAILIFVIVAALGQIGVQTTSLLAVLGAAGLAIGLALQGTLSNIAAGLMLLWLRPFHTGEYIEAGSVAGTVREVGLFVTQLDSYDGIYNFVPNSQLWNTPLINYSRNPTRMTNMAIGISYDSDVAEARRIMLELANADERLVKDPAPIVFVDTYGDSAVVLRYRVWIRNADYWDAQRALMEAVKARFDEAGIEIPFPQRVVRTIEPMAEAA